MTDPIVWSCLLLFSCTLANTYVHACTHIHTHTTVCARFTMKKSKALSLSLSVKIKFAVWFACPLKAGDCIPKPSGVVSNVRTFSITVFGLSWYNLRHHLIGTMLLPRRAVDQLNHYNICLIKNGRRKTWECS